MATGSQRYTQHDFFLPAVQKVNKVQVTKDMASKEEEIPSEQPRDVPYWHCMSKAEVVKEMDVGEDIRRKGLTTEEAQARLEKYGENKLTEKEKESLLHKIWKQVANVLVGILFVVAIVSTVSGILKFGNPVQEWIQVGIIVAVIV